MEFLRSNWSDILAHIAQHVWLVFISIAIAVAIALPLGILITRRKRLRAPVLGIANVMQTIPSLALFGFLIPLPFIGGIGPRTAIVALVFYALLPIIRNTVTGIVGVDRERSRSRRRDGHDGSTGAVSGRVAARVECDSHRRARRGSDHDRRRDHRRRGRRGRTR